MDGFVRNSFPAVGARTHTLPPDSSFAEVPWLLRVDLTDPVVQAELRRQMAMPETADVEMLLAEIEANHDELLREIEASEGGCNSQGQ